MKIGQQPSPNFSDRRDGKTPRYIILHYTDTDDVEESLSLLLSPEKEVSAHYLIGEEGGILQLVDEEKRAWHAGKSYWRGETDMNSASIGIEIQNQGHSAGLKPFPSIQIAAVIELCQTIMQRWNIPPQNILAHSDIAPGRKIDPGPLFPWQELATHGVGIWPQDLGEMPSDIVAGLHAFGYDPTVDPETLISAFQLHFDPESYMRPDPAPQTAARLANLLKLV